jgi:hypothetical protein
MEVSKLAELYLSRVETPFLSRSELDKEIAWLTGNNWSAEQIFFSINYCSKFKPSELEKSLKDTLESYRSELLTYFEIAKAKQARKALKECEQRYDQSNTFKRTDTPSWFRKSFDKHLFE